MEISGFEIYLIMTADQIATTIWITAVLTLFVSAILAIQVMSACKRYDEDDDTFETKINSFRSILKKILPIGIVLVVLGTFTPKTDTLIAAYSVPTVLEAADSLAKSDRFTELGNNSLDALNRLLKSYNAQESED